MVLGRRRRLILAMAAVVCGAFPMPGVWSQQRPASFYKIGVLHGATQTDAASELTTFRDALSAAGFVEGRNLRIAYRFAGYDYRKLDELARDLVREGVDAIYAPTTSAVLAAQESTRSIPIVFSAVNDPVRRGLVRSLARPGGNVTGVALASAELTAKRVQLMKELFPGRPLAGFVYDKDAALECGIELKDVGSAGRQLGLDVKLLSYGQRSELSSAFAAAKRDSLSALLVPTTYETRRFGADLERESVATGVPLIHSGVEAVEAGGLLSYGPSRKWAVSRAAQYIARILNGARPVDLPVERPSRYELVINMKAARSMAITIPPSILLRADRVIE